MLAYKSTMGNMKVAPLAGSAVVVTRPGERGRELVSELKRLGANAIHAEVMTIDLQPSNPAMHDALTHLDQSSLLVFVSRHAAQAFGEGMLLIGQTMPSTTRVAAIGSATAYALQQYGIGVDFVPTENMTSEGLLENLDLTDVNGNQITIFRGQRGRELLSASFRQQGAKVLEIACYQRCRKIIDLNHEIAALESSESKAIVCTSVELVEAFLGPLSESQKMIACRSDLVVFSQRIAEAARNAGFSSQIVIAQSTDNAGLINGLLSIHANSERDCL